MKPKKIFYLFAVAIFCVVMAGCEKPNAEQLIVGKWVTSDNHAGKSDTIVFTEDFKVLQYFNIPPTVHYSLSGNKITFTSDWWWDGEIEYAGLRGEFEYILKRNSLILKEFSYTRTDVKFTRVQ